MSRHTSFDAPLSQLSSGRRAARLQDQGTRPGSTNSLDMKSSSTRTGCTHTSRRAFCGPPETVDAPSLEDYRSSSTALLTCTA